MSSTVDGLVGFLAARLDEDEAPGVGAVHYKWCDGEGPDCACGIPEFLRADVAAKRTVVRQAQVWLDGEPDDGTFSDRMARQVYADVLRALAQPYREHPDWRQEWTA